jgi:D-isomer specific 2-hydroxyacid dehydrogenase, NAD binding domain
MTYRHVTAPTQFVEANGIRFAYRRFGQEGGTPLLFMQHFRGGMDHWDPAVTDGFAKNHLILSDRTRGLVGAAELALMKPTARLVNTSRGPIVDEQALIETLRAGAIAGAAVDVFDTEPLPEKHPFRSLKNLLATPHIGFVAEDLYRTFYGDAAAAIGAWIEKQSRSP